MSSHQDYVTYTSVNNNSADFSNVYSASYSSYGVGGVNGGFNGGVNSDVNGVVGSGVNSGVNGGVNSGVNGSVIGGVSSGVISDINRGNNNAGINTVTDCVGLQHGGSLVVGVMAGVGKAGTLVPGCSMDSAPAVATTTPTTPVERSSSSCSSSGGVRPNQLFHQSAYPGYVQGDTGSPRSNLPVASQSATTSPVDSPSKSPPSAGICRSASAGGSSISSGGFSIVVPSNNDINNTTTSSPARRVVSLNRHFSDRVHPSPAYHGFNHGFDNNFNGVANYNDIKSNNNNGCINGFNNIAVDNSAFNGNCYVDSVGNTNNGPHPRLYDFAVPDAVAGAPASGSTSSSTTSASLSTYQLEYRVHPRSLAAYRAYQSIPPRTTPHLEPTRYLATTPYLAPGNPGSTLPTTTAAHQLGPTPVAPTFHPSSTSDPTYSYPQYCPIPPHAGFAPILGGPTPPIHLQRHSSERRPICPPSLSTPVVVEQPDPLPVAPAPSFHSPPQPAVNPMNDRRRDSALIRDLRDKNYYPSIHSLYRDILYYNTCI